MTDGGKTWIFHLRRGVQFHDGSAVDAEAVRFSFERLLTIGKGPAGVFKRMGLTSDQLRAVDSHTVEVRLDPALWIVSGRHPHTLHRQPRSDQSA